MKRIKKFIVCLVAVFLLCGCRDVESVNTDNTQKSMFVRIETASTWSVVYHRETKVMYVVSCGGYNGGNFTLLVNADGTPMLYEK